MEKEFISGDYLSVVRDVFGNISCDDANCILNKYTNFLFDTPQQTYEQLKIAYKIINEKRESNQY